MMPRRTLLIATLAALLAAPMLWDYAKPRRLEPVSAPASVRADRILIEKAARRMTLFRDGRPIAEYRVALGPSPFGPKERKGDGRTPEGEYAIDAKRPQSDYHLALRISYPDPADAARAEALGVPPGGDIMIHGLPNGFGPLGALHRLLDWTDGCIAVTNSEIEEIWSLTDTGTPVKIVR
jgi:murein L,D-transpeptidase YafK